MPIATEIFHRTWLPEFRSTPAERLLLQNHDSSTKILKHLEVKDSLSDLRVSDVFPQPCPHVTYIYSQLIRSHIAELDFVFEDVVFPCLTERIDRLRHDSELGGFLQFTDAVNDRLQNRLQGVLNVQAVLCRQVCFFSSRLFPAASHY